MSYIKPSAPRRARRGIRALATLLSIILFIAPAGCGQQKSTLRVGVMPDLDSIPLMLAAQAGYLPGNIVLEPFKSPVERDSALFSGRLDGAVSDLLAAFLAVDGGQNYKALTVTDGCYKLVAGKGSGIQSLKDLAGRSVGMSIHTIIEYAADQMLLSVGLQPDSITKQAVPSIPARLELLKAGKLDAAVLPEPYASEAAAGGCRLIASSTDLGLDAGILLFSADALKDKPALLKELIAGYDRAVEDLQAGRVDIDRAAAALGLPDTLKKDLLPAYRTARPPAQKDLSAAVGWLDGKSLLSTGLDPASILCDLNALGIDHG